MFRSEIHGVPVSRIALLRGLPMFAHYGDRELARIDALVYDTILPTGARLAVEGQVRRQAFIIVSGEASISAGATTIGTARAGDMVGDLSLTGRGPCAATVTALTPLRVLVMDPREFVTLMSDPRAQVQAAVPLARRHARPAAALHVPA